jgi:hypothetical protein
MRRSRLALAFAGAAAALAVSAGSAPAAAPAPAAPPRQYTAAQVHHFLARFYGHHGPTAWQRRHEVTPDLQRRAARTTGFDLLLCAQNTPRDIHVGKVTTAASAGAGWATVTSSWGGDSTSSFTAYVLLDRSRPLELADVSCAS